MGEGGEGWRGRGGVKREERGGRGSGGVEREGRGGGGGEGRNERVREVGDRSEAKFVSEGGMAGK